MIDKLHVFVLAAIALTACEQRQEPAAAEAPAEPPAAEQATEAPAAEAEAKTDEDPTEDAVPIPEDFADEAEQNIDESNYKAELDAIEQELELDEESE